MKQLKHFDRIYAYAEGQMDEGQRQAFEAELSANAELRAEYDAFLASQKAMEVLAFDELKNKIGEKKKEGKIIPLWQNKWLQVAAVAALIIAAAIWLWPTTPSLMPQEITEKYYVDPNLSGTRGKTNPSTLDLALEAYEMDNLADAIMLAASVHRDSADFIAAQFLLGHAYFKSDSLNLSATAFSNVTDGGNEHNAAFSKALVLLLAEEKEAAKKLLKNIIEKNKGGYVDRAKEVLNEIQ